MPITLADVTPDGRTLVTATLDGTVRVTDLQTAVMMAPFDPAPIFEQHVQPLLKAAVAKVDAWFGRLQEQPAPSGTEDYLRGDPFRLHALLIGVSRYPKLQAYQQLPRAVVDAQGLQSVLVEKLKVPPDNIMLLTEHSSLSTIETAYRNHLAKLRPNDVSLVFFSGHGVQEVDRPYLLPADFDPRQAGAAISGIRLDELLERFQQRRSNNLGIFIVDAAPVAIASTQEVKVPASLGPVQAPEGTFVLYSASAGQVALSNLGTGDTSQYSVFMRRLLELLPDTQLGLTELASRLRYDVYNLAQHRRTESGALAPHVQTPAYYDGLVERRNILGQLLPPRPQ